MQTLCQGLNVSAGLRFQTIPQYNPLVTGVGFTVLVTSGRWWVFVPVNTPSAQSRFCFVVSELEFSSVCLLSHQLKLFLGLFVT